VHEVGQTVLVRRYPWATLLAGVIPTSAAAVVTVSIVGDRSTTDYGGGLDYMAKPLPISSAVVAVLGVVSLALYAGAAAFLVRSGGDLRSRRGWIRCVLLLTVVGMILGVSYRIVTAGVIGANIGGGAVILIGLPFCAVLVAVAVRVSPRDRDRRRAPAPR
jgi:hypothetical protein